MTKVQGLDTVKVLAKKIAPGQEHLDAYYETLGKREWYSDHGTETPNNVFVSGSQHVIDRLLKTVARPSSCAPGHHYTWGFESRGDADRFVSMLYAIDGVSFWQVGVDRSYAVASEAPLLGYFTNAEPSRISLSDETLETELVRVQAHLLFKEYGRQIGVSVVLVTGDVMQKGALGIPEGSKPMMVLDYEKSKPEPGALAYKPDERTGKVVVKGKTLHYARFQEPTEANAYFAQAVATGVGKVWHFGLNSSF